MPAVLVVKRTFVAVVAVEGWRPRAAGELILADPLQAVGIGLRHRAADQLVEHLGVARGIQRVDQVLRGRAAHGFADAVAVAVVGHAERSVREHVVFEVVGAGGTR